MKVLIACEESQAVCMAFRELGHEAYSCDILDCSGGHPEWHIKDDAIRAANGWIKVVHADECLCEDWDEDRECIICQICEIEYSECYHPRPTMDYEYQEFDGVLYAKSFEWDMMVAFPPCDHLAVSGSAHFEKKRKDGRQQKAIEFFLSLTNTPIKKWAIENPIGIMSSEYRKPDTIIHPYHFGDAYSKTTCLWLKGLPKLKATNYDAPLFGMTIDKGDFFEWTDKNGNKKRQNRHNANNLMFDNTGERKKQRSKTFIGIAKAMAEQWGGKIN